MKRVFLLMTTILLLMMPLGCTQTPQEEAPPEQEPEQTQPLHLTSLSIELQRDGQDAQQLLETTLDPETRMLKLVEIEDARMASEVTEMLMGTEVPPRRAFIYRNATDAELDI